jgi:hypothetical protein
MKALLIARIILINVLWFAFINGICWAWAWFTDTEKNWQPWMWDDLHTEAVGFISAITFLGFFIDALTSCQKIIKRKE